MAQLPPVGGARSKRHKLAFPSSAVSRDNRENNKNNAVGRKTNAGWGKYVSPKGTVLEVSSLLEDTAAVPGAGIVEQPFMLARMMESVIVGL